MSIRRLESLRFFYPIIEPGYNALDKPPPQGSPFVDIALIISPAIAIQTKNDRTNRCPAIFV